MNFVLIDQPDPIAILRKRLPWFISEHDSPYMVFSELAHTVVANSAVGEDQTWFVVADLLEELVSLKDPGIDDVLILGFKETLEHDPAAMNRLLAILPHRTATILSM